MVTSTTGHSSTSTLNDRPSMGSTAVKGLWQEAYELLIRDPNNAGLVKAYESALLHEEKEGEGPDNDEHGISPLLHTIVRRKLEDIRYSLTKFRLGGKEIFVKDQVRRGINLVVSVQGIVTTAVSSEPHAAVQNNRLEAPFFYMEVYKSKRNSHFSDVDLSMVVI